MSAIAIDFRPDAPEFLRDPFPLYLQMREEDPVHWSPRIGQIIRHLTHWMVFRGVESLPLNVSR